MVELVHRAARIDNRLRDQGANKNSSRIIIPATMAQASPSTNYAARGPDTGHTPVIIDAVRRPFTKEESEARFRSGQCFYCGDASHMLREYSNLNKRRVGNTTPSPARGTRTGRDVRCPSPRTRLY